MKAVAVFLACLAVVALAAETQDAQGLLIIHKKVDTVFPNVYAEGVNFTVTIDLYNVGTGAAYEVTVNDPWPANGFDVAEGDMTHKFEEIAAGTNTSYNFTLTPKIVGEFGAFRAYAEYLPTLESEKQFALTTGVRNGTIFPLALYERYTSKRQKEWAIFIVASLATVLLPLLAYVSAQRSYTVAAAQKKDKKSSSSSSAAAGQKKAEKSKTKSQ